MKKNVKIISSKNFILNIIIPTVLSILLFVFLIFWYIIPYFETSLLNSKKDMIRELVSAARSIAEKNFNDYRIGLISESEAKEDAISKINVLRYGVEQKDYFFIIDTNTRLVLHPYREDLIGEDLSDFKDPNEKKLFSEMVKLAKTSFDGFVDYKWQWMDDTSRIVPKISYVKTFMPWGWVICTGIYIEDIKEKISEIEREMVIVSIVISGIIAILLMIIAYQNYRTELKRSNTEKELMISNQKYKTLVEASTEGTAMLLDGELIYSNKLFDNMFNNLNNGNIFKNNIPQLIYPEKNEDKESISNLVNGEINYLQYEKELLTNNNTYETILVSLSKITLNNKDGLIINIKELKGDFLLRTEHLKWERNLLELILAMNRAMFKISVNDYGRFVDVNSAALKVLGYDAKTELLRTKAQNIFENKTEGAILLKAIKQKGFITDYRISARKYNGELITLSIDAKYVIDSSNNQEYIIGMLSDITEKVRKEEIKDNSLAEILASMGHWNKELHYVQRETISCNMNLPISKAAFLMLRNHTDALLIRTDKGEPVGIVTITDILKRYFSGGQSEDIPIFEIMSSPIFALSENSMLTEAVVKMEEKNIQHIFVKDNSNKVTGIIGIEEILQNHYETAHLLLARVKNANTIAELKAVFNRLPYYVNSSISAGTKSYFIIKTVSETASAITKRISELIFYEIGEPPVEFVFVSLGSEGREEQTLITDQDNAIIYDDVDDSLAENAQNYFARFAERMNYMLDAVGYSYCKGDIMAKNPKWNKPIKVWKSYFNEWIRNPEPQNLVDISVFFDMKANAGNSELLRNLFEHISLVLRSNPAFFGFMARVGASYKTQVSFFGKIQTEAIEEHSKSVNIKNALRVITNLVRLYAMKNNIKETNTLQRMKKLYENNIFSEDFYRDMLFSYDLLTKLQLRTQAKYIFEKAKPSNYIDLTYLSSIEISLLKNIFSQIHVFQTKLKYDFGLSE